MTVLILFGLAALVGVLIGIFSIGGVLLAPGLIHLLQVAPREAVAACMICYLFSGCIGAFGFMRKLSIDAHQALVLVTAAIPGAFLGALLLGLVPASLVELAIAALLLGSGIWILWGPKPPARDARSPAGVSAHPARSRLAALGLATGMVSALTGTGGPVTLVPLLLASGMPAIAAIGLGQVIQVPIAGSATLGNLLAGPIADPLDWRRVGALALPMCIAISLGTWAGVRVAHAIPAQRLRAVLATLIMLLGGFLLVQLARR